jgi:phosphoenolpyruvate synthase/pyruvate phosphate dikinase
MAMIARYVLGLEEIDRTQVALAGGKGANLGELSRIEGVRGPAGFCVTTDAYQRILAAVPGIDGRLGRLAALDPGDAGAIRTLSAEIRAAIEGTAVPGELVAEITRAIAGLGSQAACAVRSSATAEDLPTASFAGQQDTYLNVIGTAEIIRRVGQCWASLFTERAVAYRLRNGFDHRTVSIAVVVQEMVFPQAAGILFTADPVTSDRTVVSVEASFGLGEALVAGLVNPDVYRVRDGEITDRTIGVKRRAVAAAPGGGTRELAVEPERQEQPALTDPQVLELAALGRRIEAHFGQPQDIEWCLAGPGFQIVQSRPITTLFPVPEADDHENHVYISVGHQQMMTDAMKPLGISMWQLTAGRPMVTAGGRLFADATDLLGSPTAREAFVTALERSDPLIGDALRTVLDRDGFVPARPDVTPAWFQGGSAPAPEDTDPVLVAELTERGRAAIAALKRDITGLSGLALLDFILGDVQELKQFMFAPRNSRAIMAGMQPIWKLNEQLQQWLGEKNAVDTLTQSVPGNVTAEMGTALLDVADVIRPHPDVVAFLQHVNADDEGFLDKLPALPGGREARDAIAAFLGQYGMRCVGEIDITTPRWSERPAALVPLVLGNVRNFEPGAGERRFAEGLRRAREKEQEVLARLRTLPDGERKAAAAKREIDQIRAFAGYREYPKYHMVSRYFVYKQALLAEAGRLARAGVLRDREDIFYLTFAELRDVVRTNQADARLIRQRMDSFRSYQSLTPPRVLTSDGEAVAGAYRRDDLPAGALAGLAVSAGIVEGRARVVLDLAEAALEPGDILVTAYTDPSWTPAFVTIAGLVTEVGGQLTHGAVIAREYGLPAVVGVEHATRLIRDGQRIRVHGTDGFVELRP